MLISQLFVLYYAATTVTDYFSGCNLSSVLASLSLFARREVLEGIEHIIQGIVSSLSKDEAPILVLPNRSSWANVR